MIILLYGYIWLNGIINQTTSSWWGRFLVSGRHLELTEQARNELPDYVSWSSCKLPALVLVVFRWVSGVGKCAVCFIWNITFKYVLEKIIPQ